jgi:hypothetical protein
MMDSQETEPWHLAMMAKVPAMKEMQASPLVQDLETA